MGMFGISAVMMIAGQRGSYALAGAVTATGLAATALVAPWTARLVDRYGQARIAVPATLIAVLGSVGLILCVRAQAPAWTLFACYAATATTPNIGGMSRARWTHLLRGAPAAHHTAMSFEQAADELCYMCGPVVAAFLCSAVFPEAGTLTAAALLLTGMLLFTSQRATEPPVSAPRHGTSPFRAVLPSWRSSSRWACCSARWRSPRSPTSTRRAWAPPPGWSWPSRRRAPARRACSTAPCARAACGPACSHCPSR